MCFTCNPALAAGVCFSVTPAFQDYWMARAGLIQLKQTNRYPCPMASLRIKLRFPVIFLLLLPAFLSPDTVQIHAQAAPTKPQPPATILLIRHAEKLTDGRIDLSPTVFARP